MLPVNKIYTCDALSGLKQLDEGSVQCCVTSPPYYRLRDYGMAGQIGQEDSPEQYLERLIAIFDEVRRVLTPMGTLWINMGDSYWGSSSKRPTRQPADETTQNAGRFSAQLPDKSLLGLPWRLALSLQQKGWIFRQDIVWAKKNCMPESVTDRCTRAHEYIFMFSKQPKYYYDIEAVQTPTKVDSVSRMQRGHSNSHKYTGALPGAPPPQSILSSERKTDHMGKRHAGFDDSYQAMQAQEGPRPMSRLRSVWHLSTKPLKEAHFAAFPIEIPSICIKAGSAPGHLVLDMFMGSGTTAIAAASLQRNFIGFELNPGYTAMAESRLRKHLGLFYNE